VTQHSLHRVGVFQVMFSGQFLIVTPGLRILDEANGDFLQHQGLGRSSDNRTVEKVNRHAPSSADWEQERQRNVFNACLPSALRESLSPALQYICSNVWRRRWLGLPSLLVVMAAANGGN